MWRGETDMLPVPKLNEQDGDCLCVAKAEKDEET